MKKISEKDLFLAISKALDVDSSLVDLDSSSENIEEWDSSWEFKYSNFP